MGLFDGGANGDDRIKMVIAMLGRHPDEFESEVTLHFASELLAKAERHALHWLQYEISEAMRGATARRVLRKYQRS